MKRPIRYFAYDKIDVLFIRPSTAEASINSISYFIELTRHYGRNAWAVDTHWNKNGSKTGHMEIARTYIEALEFTWELLTSSEVDFLSFEHNEWNKATRPREFTVYNIDFEREIVFADFLRSLKEGGV